MSTVTGVNPDVELKRIKEETNDKPEPRRPEVNKNEMGNDDDEREAAKGINEDE